MEEAETLKAIAETSISRETEKINQQFHVLLAKVNKENPRPGDVEAFSNLLNNNKCRQLWKRIMGMGSLAEHNALDNFF